MADLTDEDIDTLQTRIAERYAGGSVSWREADDVDALIAEVRCRREEPAVVLTEEERGLVRWAMRCVQETKHCGTQREHHRKEDALRLLRLLSTPSPRTPEGR